MNSRKVLDSYALIAFLDNETGAEKVSVYIKQARDHGKPLYLSVINWGEVFYILCRTAGKDTAEQIIQSIETLPIEIVPADRELTRIAAELKSCKKMSYADCFAAALAKTRRASLITGDKEFKEVEDEISVHWL